MTHQQNYLAKMHGESHYSVHLNLGAWVTGEKAAHGVRGISWSYRWCPRVRRKQGEDHCYRSTCPARGHSVVIKCFENWIGAHQK